MRQEKHGGIRGKPAEERVAMVSTLLTLEKLIFNFEMNHFIAVSEEWEQIGVNRFKNDMSGLEVETLTSELLFKNFICEWGGLKKG